MTPSHHLHKNRRLRWRQSPYTAGALLFTWTFLCWSTGSGLLVTSAPLAADTAEKVNVSDVDTPKERWLADPAFYDVDDLPVDVADSLTTDVATELCPRVPQKLPVSSCDVEQCASDDECSERQLKCCYNGCVYTCLPEIHPAPYFDWIREPKRKRQDGRSWLIPGPDEKINLEMCSTSNLEEDDDADSLVCPHGYRCSIDNPGKPEAGIPNIGHCVKIIDVRTLAGNPKSQPKLDPDQMLQADAPYSIFPTGQNCLLGYGGLMLLSGHSVTKDGRECFCVKSELKCGQKGVPPT